MSKKSSQEIASSDIYRSRRHLDKIYHETISKRSQSKYKNSRKKALETIEKNAYTQDLASYLDQVHKTFKRLNRMNPDSKGRQEEYLLEKICEKCVTIKSDELLLLCDICDDAYHTYCLDPPLQELPPEDESWICPLCVEQQAKQGATVKEEPMDVENIENNNPNSYGKRERQSRLEEHFEMKQASVKMCFECKEEIQEVHKMASLENIGKNHKPAKIKSYEMCIKCQHLFHPKCFNTNKNTILCEKCQGCVTETMPHNESTILDFFNVALKNGNTQMSEENENSNCSSIQRLNSPVRKSRISKAKRKSSKVSLQRKKLKFRLPKISEEPEIALGRKKSLAYALLSKDIVFDDDLCFSNPECPPTCNNAQLEPNLQKMDKTNAEIFHEFKSMTRKGDYPPVMIQEDKNQGFVVKADEDIPRLTLLAEYVGEVDFARQRLFDRNDSIMDLLRTSHSTTSLVICPEKRGNLARFISGINNFDQKAKIHKQNVKSIRYNIDGHARVFLYAEKVIKKDDVLYYDYNEGGFNDYPTEEFV